MSNNLIIVAGVVLVMIGTLLTYLGTDRKNKETNNLLQQSINSKNTQIDELVEGKDQLITQNKELDSKIEKYQKDLKTKEEEIIQLKKETKKAKRGISSMYDFDGTKRETTRPGHFYTTIGSERTVFETMIKLEQEKNYIKLIEVCKKQIEDTPEWLTPYFYLGIAYYNLGQKDDAVEQFEYVLDNAPDDPSYSKAAEFLKILKGK